MNIHRQKPNDEIIIKYWWKLVNIHMRLFPGPECRRSFPILNSLEWSGGSFPLGLWRADFLHPALARTMPRDEIEWVQLSPRILSMAGQQQQHKHTMDEIAIYDVDLYLFCTAEKVATRQRGRRWSSDGDWFNLMTACIAPSRRWVCIICILECVLLLIVIEQQSRNFNPSSL